MIIKYNAYLYLIGEFNSSSNWNNAIIIDENLLIARNNPGYIYG